MSYQIRNSCYFDRNLAKTVVLVPEVNESVDFHKNRRNDTRCDQNRKWH